MFPALLDKLRRDEDLTAAEAARAMSAIMDGGVDPVHISALLVALAMKGERPAEVAGFARAMLDRSAPLPRPAGDVFDTCGTGGDGADTFSVSTATAIVLAGCGVRVAKHGNRAASSRYGSADVFEALGVPLDAPADRVLDALDEASVGFFFAQRWHPSMRHAAPIRKAIGLRTVFNLLGPLTNPARPRRQLVGVSRPEHTELLARALADLGSERAWVVHGAGGLDELSTTGYSKVSAVDDGLVRTFYLHPADAGLPVAAVRDLRLDVGLDDGASAVRRLIEGERGPRRDIVLLNAGAGLLIADRVSSIGDGVVRAAEAIDAGRAKAALDTLVRVTRG